MKIIKRIKSTAIAVLTAITAVTASYSASALDTTSEFLSTITTSSTGEVIAVYNANDMPAFADRTMQEVGEKYSDAIYGTSTYDNRHKDTWYAEEPSLEAPYDPGVLSDDAQQAMIDMLNFYRWLMGCQPASLNTEYNDEMQYGAMVRNFDCNHVVNEIYKPEDMPDEIWQAGADCKNNILASGFSPQGAVTGWMNEGYDVELETWTSSGIGHRALTMRMTLSEMAFGYSGQVAIGRRTAASNTNNQPFTAYPSPGYMPSQILNASISAWTVELNSDMFEIEYVEDVVVTITNIDTGQEWVRTSDDETLLLSSFGCLAFAQPNDYGDTGYTDTYKVTITGIDDISQNVKAQVTYTVDFFDLYQYAETRIASAETSMKYMLAPEMMSSKNLEYIASIIPDTVTVPAENGQLIDVPVAGKWEVDMENQCFYNSAKMSGLPDRVSDYYGYLEHITIPYEEKAELLVKYDTLDIVPNMALSGGNVSLTTYRTQITTDTVHIFKLIDMPDGSCISIKMFDSAKTEEGCDDVFVGYDIECVAPEDSGKYISVYYSQLWLNGRQITPVYVSSNIAELRVNTKYYDLDGDGDIGVSDLVVMEKVLSGNRECPESADCDQNGRVNIFDMIMLKNMLNDQL